MSSTPKFNVGDRVEFYSSEHGGMWKPGVIVEQAKVFLYTLNKIAPKTSTCVRIAVGNGVCIMRHADKCRLVSKRKTASEG